MASISDTLVQSALTQATGDQAAQGVESMAKLGEHIQNVQLKRQQIEQQKAQMQAQKLENFVGAIEKGKKFTGSARNNYYKNFLPRYRDSMGLSEMFPDEALNFSLSADPDLARFSVLKSKVQRGELSAENAILIWKDPLKLADVTPGLPNEIGPSELSPEMSQELLETEKTAEGFRAQSMRQQVQIDAKKAAETTEFDRTADKEVRKKIAADYAQFTSGGGGLASAENKLAKLEKVLEKLKTGKIKTRTLSTMVPGLSSETAQSRLNPELKAAMDDVRSAISLKGSLDSQFSAKEADIAFGRAFDPALPTDQNIEKVQNMLNELRGDLKSKVREFKSIGFNVELKNDKTQNQTIVKNIQQKIQQNPNISDEELIQALSARMNRQTAIQLVKEARGSK